MKNTAYRRLELGWSPVAAPLFWPGMDCSRVIWIDLVRMEWHCRDGCSLEASRSRVPTMKHALPDGTTEAPQKGHASTAYPGIVNTGMKAAA
ncbi:MAG: hypothetical protein JSR34_04950 [Proteobacteria bacterium]|nr:hypothetical protein [Pseudomonadota bacterium]